MEADGAYRNQNCSELSKDRASCCSLNDDDDDDGKMQFRCYSSILLGSTFMAIRPTPSWPPVSERSIVDFPKKQAPVGIFFLKRADI